MKLTGETEVLGGKIPTWTGPVSNPGLRGGRPAANRLSHGTARKEGFVFAVVNTAFVRVGEFLRCLLLKQDFAPWNWFVSYVVTPRLVWPVIQSKVRTWLVSCLRG
jgi:hypothetical protein